MSTAIKICGVRDVETAEQAIELGAQYVGIIMYPSSKRYVEIDTAADIAKAVKSAGGIPVLVFVDETAEQMQEKCEAIDVDTVQLQGNTPRCDHFMLPDYYHRIYVLHVDQNGIIQGDSDDGISHLKMDRDLLMYDAMKGGSGKCFPLEHFKNRYDFRFFLAGGLRPESVSEAIKKVHPYGVDVSSGVENAPGKKDINFIKTFIQNVRETE